MPRRTVALVTCDDLPALSPDDRLLLEPLMERAVRAVAVSWSAPRVDWSTFDAIVVRSTWDYHLRVTEFFGWIDEIAAQGVPLWNRPALLRWNANKRYLGELELRGVPVVPTRWIPQRPSASLVDLMEEEGWSDAVLKPSISASSHETWQVDRLTAAAIEPRFQAMVAEREMMLQPFVHAVAAEGEWSFIFLDGQLSHVVLKRPAAGEFRVQQAFGGTVVAAEPGAPAFADAHAALRACPDDTLYARVDGCVAGGRLQVMEVELIEPSLFLALHPDAPGRFADAIARTARATETLGA